MTDQRVTDMERRRVDPETLRVVPPNGWLEDQFCALCRCSKSGWVDQPNMIAEWCEDMTCPCHDDDNEVQQLPGLV